MPEVGGEAAVAEGLEGGSNPGAPRQLRDGLLQRELQVGRRDPACAPYSAGAAHWGDRGLLYERKARPDSRHPRAPLGAHLVLLPKPVRFRDGD